MKFSDFPTGNTIMSGFLIVVLVLAAAILFQVNSMVTMTALQSDASKRAEDALP